MAEENYQKRELDSKFQDVHDKLDDILTQTKNTNGRVTKLEKWMYMMLGGMVIINLMVVPLIITWAMKSMQ